MKEKQRRFGKGQKIKRWPILLIGIVLLLVTVFVHGSVELNRTKEMAENTVDTLRQQCQSFNRLLVSDRTKSLFRLSDILLTVSHRLGENPNLATKSYLKECVSDLRLNGIALLDENGTMEAAYYDKTFEKYDWRSTVGGKQLLSGIQGTKKVYVERIGSNGQCYDICAVARQDQEGLLIGFYEQPVGLLTDTENDLELLLSGLHLERNGTFLIVENDTVLATGDFSLQGKTLEDSSMLRSLDALSRANELQLFACEDGLFYGYRAAAQDYQIYLYFPVLSVFGATLVVAGVFAALYIAFWSVFIALRNYTLYESRRELEESNRHLQKTVNMLYSLENIYFTIFNIDVTNNRYESVFLAPWFSGSIPESGVYEELKSALLKLVLEEYRQEIDEKMNIEAIRESLAQEKLSAVRCSFYIDYRAICGDTINWCRVTVIAVDFDKEGKPLHILAVLQDVNEEKEKEVQYQAQILEEAQEAKIANLAKTEFLRRISHDIRTPINGVQGYLNMAARFPNDEAMQISCRKKANTALNYLLDLINNVLDMSKMESNEIHLEQKPFDLIEIADEIKVIVEPKAMEMGITYEAECQYEESTATHLIGSPLHLRQILMNLTSNAIKYGREGGYVRMKSYLVTKNQDMALYEFICEDNGIGMSEEFQKHLFEPFTQETLDARTKYQGCGLGLSIVKKLVDVMGGTITFTSQKNVGTTFKVTLPFRIDHNFENRDAKQKAQISLEGIHVLLAEDNELNMEIAEFLLQEHGVSVDKAWNGKEAVEAFASKEPGYYDLILMDVMMPEVTGTEAATIIRKMERADAKQIPIVAMSANAFADDIQRSLDAGMNDHLAKPIDEQKLLAVIEKVMGENPAPIES